MIRALYGFYRERIMRAYDIESIVIGIALRYNESCNILLPELTKDKFIYNMNGEFGTEHAEIWQTIFDVFLVDQVFPTLVDITNKLPEKYHAYVWGCIDRLEKVHGIFSYDVKQTIRFGQMVDRAGVVYNVSRRLRPIGMLSSDSDIFQRNVDSIECVESWINDLWNDLQTNLKIGSNGYQHVSVAVEEQIETWERQFKGEQLDILPCGMPTLMSHHLFPAGKIAAVHGLSNSGKSTFVHLVNLGTAMGLVANNIPGCVAINSLEMRRGDLINRFAASLAQVDVSRFRGGKKPITLDELKALKDWAELVAKLPIFIDDTSLASTSIIEYRASGLHVSEYGPIKQLSFDYNELLTDNGQASEELRVHQIFRNQLAISRELGASVIAVGQSTSRDDTSGIAGALGTRYSRGILQNCDILVEIVNPIEAKRMGLRVNPPDPIDDAHFWVLIEKYRDGMKGAIPFGWLPEYTLFYDLELNGLEKNKTVFNHVEAAREILMSTKKRLVSPQDTGALW